MAVTNAITANSNIWQKTESDPYASGTDRLASDKHTFLKLLVAQLSNQDPLNPTEDKEFVAQLAQFTSLEQLQEINAGMENLNTTMTSSQLMTATGFIGKDVVAKGNQVTKLSVAGQVVTTRSWFSIEEPAARVQVTILDGNGNPVHMQELGAHQAGTHPFVWDGKNAAGQEVSNGVYSLIITAQDQNDKTVMIKQQQLTARVVGVVNEGGVYQLVLDGGRVVNLMDVTEISEPEAQQGTVTTYSGLAADASASAYLARNDAELYAQKAIGSADETDAKSYATSSINAAITARDAAISARGFADKAKGEAESLKTSSALEEYKKTADRATEAEAYATEAEDFAAAAKAHAEGLGAEF